MTLPDYEARLRENALSALLDMGVPPGQVYPEWERLLRQPLPFDLPSDSELDEIAVRKVQHSGPAE